MSRQIAHATLLLLLAFWSVPLLAQADTESLQELLEDVRTRAAEVEVENAARESMFTMERDERVAVLEAARAELQRETARSQSLRQQFDRNEIELEQLTNALRIRTGDLSELFGVFRQQLADIGGIVSTSLISVDNPGRRATVDRLTELTTQPGIADLQELQLLLLEEMTGSSAVTRFDAEVSGADGTRQTMQVVRVGVFNALASQGYLQMDEAGSGLNVLPRQPAARYQRSATDFFATMSGNASLAIDPSRGSLLSLVIQSPGLVEQASYGGGIGYLILSMGLIGIGIAVWRLFALRAVDARVASQLKSDQACADNPLGRVLSIYSDNRGADVEVLERKLDEAILKETPKLEQFQGVIKVIAGVAPLMGLLGTVVGMIRTFQTITLFGTSDPKLMADGISQALVTTVEGLIVAIPLVFLHALVSDKSRGIVDVLDEQSAGIIARHLEKAAGASSQ